MQLAIVAPFTAATAPSQRDYAAFRKMLAATDLVFTPSEADLEPVNLEMLAVYDQSASVAALAYPGEREAGARLCLRGAPSPPGAGVGAAALHAIKRHLPPRFTSGHLFV